MWQVFEAYAGFAFAIALSIAAVPAMLGFPVDEAVGMGTRTLIWMLGVPGAVVIAMTVTDPDKFREWFKNRD